MKRSFWTGAFWKPKTNANVMCQLWDAMISGMWKTRFQQIGLWSWSLGGVQMRIPYGHMARTGMSTRVPSRVFLPSEAQWEYAARGTDPQDFPWGAEECADLLNVCWDQEIHKDLNGNAPALHDFPLEPVNLTKGQSPFGLRGMAGNVWQWCRDSYDPDFYSSPLALATDAWNSLETPFRSERGGSWVGPSNLARSSFRRGRCPEAKGRCLGFRCCAPGEIVSQRSSAWSWCCEHILTQMMHWCLKGDSCTVKDSLLHRKIFRHWKSKIKSVLVSLYRDQVAWSVAIIISPHRFHHEFHPAMLKAHWPKNVLRVLMPALRKLGDSHGHIIVAPQPARGEPGG